MPIIPAYVRPIDPVPGESAGAQPVLASTPRGLGDRVNALVGWTALRWGTRHLQPGDLADDVPYAGTYDIAPIRWTRSPAAAQVWVGIWYTALEPKGSAPAITVTLEYADGVNGTDIDGPIEWSEVNGQLGVTEDIADDLAVAVAAAGSDALGAEVFYRGHPPPDRFVHTGWNVGVVGDEPRLLELPDDEHGEVQLAITGEDVRIYAVIWAEAFRPQI